MNMEPGRLKNIILNFLIPIICIGSSAILFFVVVYPGVKKIPQLQGELDSATHLRDQLKDKNAKLDRFIDFKSILEENSDLVNRVMPAEENVPGLLDQINQIATESGLELTKLSYSVSDIADKTEDTGIYSSVLISLGAEGTYTQMISFMRAIETSARLVNIQNYRFSSSGDGGNRLGFTFVLNSPYLAVSSSAVTDDPLTLDISSSEFVTFITNVKNLRYFELSGDISALKVEVTKTENVEEAAETTPSAGTPDGDSQDEDSNGL